MRLLHVIPTLAVRDGGPTTALHAWARELARLGHQVTIATTVGHEGRCNRLNWDGVDVRYFPMQRPRRWRYSRPLSSWLRREMASIDVVHVHALFSYPTIPACRLARTYGVPYVLRPLGSLDPHCLAGGWWKKLPYLRLIEHAHLERAAVLHATSAMEARALAARGYGDRVRVIPPGIIGVQECPRRGWQPPDKLRLLFLSRLHPIKGLPLLLRAAAQLRTQAVPFELAVAGGGDPQYRQRIENLVATLGLSSCVRLLGHIDPDARTALLRSADAFVLPSLHENFGIAAVEALASGLPVVITDRVGIADDVAQAGAGLVVPYDEGRLTAALSLLWLDRERIPEMSRAATRLAHARYGVETSVRALLALYREVSQPPERRQAVSAAANGSSPRDR